ncbi:hypothetical protein MFIFM68171_05669 [Madurella fahalii]|uniref:Transmembrane protein n=1 Tax=Madurella fahalii TaxID=1157608 RepID=A0ABQ0GCG6_9PEZI
MRPLQLWRRLLAIVLLVQSGLTWIVIVNSDYDLVVGVPFTLMWTGANGPVTITLYNASDVHVLTRQPSESVQDTSYTWTPPLSLAEHHVALRLVDSTDGPTFTPRLQIASSTSDSNDDAGGSGGLTTAAKAGLSVGAAAAALVLVLAIAYYVYRKGKFAGAKGGMREGKSQETL